MRVFYLILLGCILGNGQFILYKTKEMFNKNELEYDCLYYRVMNEKLVYQQLSNIINDQIEYCFRPMERSERILSHFNETDLTFEELNQLNVTAKDLLLWSIPINLVEMYQFYLDENHLSLSMKMIKNCTKPWFGIECEYSFQWIDQMSINEIVEKEFSDRIPYSNEMPMHSLTCYIHLKCDRGEGNLCLDWREICDGYVDCLNDGIDELNCIEMELNECNDNEYRCHNGLCIPEEFWENGIGEADCLDRSDEYSDVYYPNLCYKDPRFRCEDHSCRSNWHRFPCGDGQCVQKFDQCHNGRHLLLIDSISSKGNLSNECLLAMLCLTKLIDECQSLNIFNSLRSCPTIFQYPNIPIENNHIRFVYENISMKSNRSLLIIPDYICFNEQLCDCFPWDYSYENLTCVHSGIFDLTSSITEHVWIDLILLINSYFRCCLNHPIDERYLNSTNSLYQCQNSSKWISKHRLMDENLDCCLHDDETTLNSCSINRKHRVQCLNESKCLSSLHTIDDCYSHIDQIEHQIPFRSLCDGLEEYLFKDSHGNIHSDESNCHFWPCRNLYSECDGLQTCSNGEDELNCYDESICPSGFVPCISSRNLSVICLSNDRIGDGINDCIGGMDEMHFCRRVYPSDNQLKRFHCQNSDLCLELNELCNDIETCPHGDDERFCQSRLTCHKTNQSLFESILCQWNENQLNRIHSFSLQTSFNYPIIHSIEQNETLHRSISPIESSNKRERSNPWPWYCNRGLVISIRNERNSIINGCLCPPSYYGDQCEYQNERISLTIGLIPSEEDNVYVIIMFLLSLSDEQLIESYDQFEYISSESCSMKLNRYLLFSTRPKNSSKMYRIHIDVYEKTSMNYRGSWIYPIQFLFLPVNRMSTLLFISNEEPLRSNQCLNECEHGQCVQYRNNDQFYCHCSSGWKGMKCEIEINCKDCSMDSLCVGSMSNQSICICPLMKFGPRCLLHSSCDENGCLNNGQCIPSDMNLSNNDYSCICSDQFYGLRCQFIKSRLDISFEHISIPSYVLAYFVTISDQSEPTLTILLQKLTLFQRMITFRIAIPYHLVLIKSDERYYLAVVQRTSINDLSTTINPSRECLSIEMLFNSTIVSMTQYERMKYYHLPCRINEQLNCFYDRLNLCLCTKDRHANCMELKFEQNVQCSSKYSCLNGGKCLQDHPTCPSTIICVCTDCFFGNRCQFYAKGFGLTLDQILGYEIKSDRILFQQTFSVQLSALLTMIMLCIGMINGILSILTFQNKSSQEVGCGIYLLISSICSLMIVVLFTFKFWFLIYSYEKIIRFSNCMIIEPLLKLLLYIDNWLNACVASERAFAVFKGIGFNKKHSRDMAKWIIIGVILGNVLLLIPQFVYLNLFEDKKEQRTWCVVLYSSLLNNYSSFIQFFHFFAPFLINLFSAIFIIIGTTLQRVALGDEHRFTNHLKSKLKQHKHLLISPIILVILSLPRLIISFTLDCQKSSKHFWLFLIGYFISFMPSVFIFFVFVLPSPTYKKEFKQVLSRIHRSLLLFSKRSS